MMKLMSVIPRVTKQKLLEVGDFHTVLGFVSEAAVTYVTL